MAIRPRHRPTACWIRAWTFRGKTRVRVCEDADPNFFAQGACNTRARVLGAYGARVLHAPHLPPSTRRKGPMHLLPFDLLQIFLQNLAKNWQDFEEHVTYFELSQKSRLNSSILRRNLAEKMGKSHPPRSNSGQPLMAAHPLVEAEAL